VGILAQALSPLGASIVPDWSTAVSYQSSALSFPAKRAEMCVLFVHLDRGRRHVVLDARAFDAGVKVVSQTALEFAVQFAPEKEGMLSCALQ
jgi:hypothetical protein